MRKSELLRQNMELFNELSVAKKEIEELNGELANIKNQMAEFQKSAEIKKEPEIAKETEAPNEIKAPKEIEIPETVSDEKVDLKLETSTDEIELPEDLKYAADTISKLVIESTRYSNILTTKGGPAYKELINLVLGKTEVSKAEIVSVINENIDVSQKKEKLDAIKSATVEYYESVLAQC